MRNTLKFENLKTILRETAKYRITSTRKNACIATEKIPNPRKCPPGPLTRLLMQIRNCSKQSKGVPDEQAIHKPKTKFNEGSKSYADFFEYQTNLDIGSQLKDRNKYRTLFNLKRTGSHKIRELYWRNIKRQQKRAKMNITNSASTVKMNNFNRDSYSVKPTALKPPSSIRSIVPETKSNLIAEATRNAVKSKWLTAGELKSSFKPESRYDKTSIEDLGEKPNYGFSMGSRKFSRESKEDKIVHKNAYLANSEAVNHFKKPAQAPKNQAKETHSSNFKVTSKDLHSSCTAYEKSNIENESKNEQILMNKPQRAPFRPWERVFGPQTSLDGNDSTENTLASNKLEHKPSKRDSPKPKADVEADLSTQKLKSSNNTLAIKKETSKSNDNAKSKSSNQKSNMPEPVFLRDDTDMDDMDALETVDDTDDIEDTDDADDIEDTDDTDDIEDIENMDALTTINAVSNTQKMLEPKFAVNSNFEKNMEDLDSMSPTIELFNSKSSTSESMVNIDLRISLTHSDVENVLKKLYALDLNRNKSTINNKTALVDILENILNENPAAISLKAQEALEPETHTTKTKLQVSHENNESVPGLINIYQPTNEYRSNWNKLKNFKKNEEFKVSKSKIVTNSKQAIKNKFSKKANILETTNDTQLSTNILNSNTIISTSTKLLDNLSKSLKTIAVKNKSSTTFKKVSNAKKVINKPLSKKTKVSEPAAHLKSEMLDSNQIISTSSELSLNISKSLQALAVNKKSSRKHNKNLKKTENNTFRTEKTLHGIGMKNNFLQDNEKMLILIPSERSKAATHYASSTLKKVFNSKKEINPKGSTNKNISQPTFSKDYQLTTNILGDNKIISSSSELHQNISKSVQALAVNNKSSTTLKNSKETYLRDMTNTLDSNKVTSRSSGNNFFGKSEKEISQDFEFEDISQANEKMIILLPRESE